MFTKDYLFFVYLPLEVYNEVPFWIVMLSEFRCIRTLLTNFFTDYSLVSDSESVTPKRFYSFQEFI